MCFYFYSSFIEFIVDLYIVSPVKTWQIMSFYAFFVTYMFEIKILFSKESLLCRNKSRYFLFLVIYSFFPSPVETVLHKAGPGADQGDGHRLGDESHLRHVCET